MGYVWQALTNLHGIKTNPTLAARSVDDPYQSRPSLNASTLKVQAVEYFDFLSGIPLLLLLFHS